MAVCIQADVRFQSSLHWGNYSDSIRGSRVRRTDYVWFQSSLHWGNYSDPDEQIRWVHGPSTCFNPLFIEAIILTLTGLSVGNQYLIKVSILSSLRQLFWPIHTRCMSWITTVFLFQSSLHWGNYSDPQNNTYHSNDWYWVSILSSLRQLFWPSTRLTSGFVAWLLFQSSLHWGNYSDLSIWHPW